jgi:hypothetical protein
LLSFFKEKRPGSKEPSFEWTILSNQLPKTQISSIETALSVIQKAIDAARKRRKQKVNEGVINGKYLFILLPPCYPTWVEFGGCLVAQSEGV